MSAFLSKSKDIAEENKDSVVEDKEKGEGATGEAPMPDEKDDNESEEKLKPLKEDAEILPPPETENKNPPPNPYAEKKETDSDEEFQAMEGGEGETEVEQGPQPVGFSE